ncbi:MULTISPECIES: alpha/beta fold hydrolase [Gordonia]|uniref:Alpha/beta hydrolase n=1 Tax=Gordonia jacobaea TaxID=122202 RepID=A0ABR5IGQ7_9ACTN|nr:MULTISPECIES: alpha/beta hydrolase [Gordonia]KNA92773.1 alpha/beta hydrolase [Gordonia jacobaea]OBB99439.1 alpha/beta hydrolase [Gordonia sp. 852002-50395_SCH5434458]OBC11235.1 alpha/beta hydrolase [Gordonia sp. 852002-50816_SCH5313054-c]OBC14491.1 alpha/beta hydrolase [Gordonia sp. 852002-50816_SCH5313054-a]
MSTDSAATDFPPTTARTPIVLVHGLRVSGQTFRRVAGSLADREVVCPDMPGHGSRADETFTLDGAVVAVSDAIDSVGGSALVVGMSMGGYVAMATAARHPDRVAGLGVLCATAQPSGLLAAPFRLFGAATSVLPSEAAQVSRVLTRIAVGREVSDDMEAGGLALHSIRDVVDAVLHFDALAALAAYPGPTLFANGAWDQFRLHEKRFVETAADGHLVVVPRAMHLFPLIQPEFTAGLIDDFADTVDSADRAPLH